jgi:Ca2+-binding EF-hand superfamily protein
MGDARPSRKLSQAASDFICHSLSSKPPQCFTQPMTLLPLLILAASSAGQAPAAPAPVPGPTPRTALPWRRGSGRPFISPMGEPFRPESRDENGLAEWFRQADRNHDGQLTIEEMQADAERFFALLDVNHDGEIDPEEIDRYETVVAPEISSGPHFAFSAMDGGAQQRSGRGGGQWGHGGGGHRHGGGGEGGGVRFHPRDMDPHQGAARFGLLDLPEPVTAADTNFNRGVSLEEFKQAAGQRFLALDLDHHGYLTLDGLQRIRPAPPAEPNRNPSTDNPPPDQDTQSYQPPDE